jgi:hypothetical protein
MKNLPSSTGQNFCPGVFLMKHAIALILSLALVPSALAQQEYREKIYVFSMDYTSGVFADSECADALRGIKTRLHVTGINANLTERFKIYAVDAAGGLVTRMAGEAIGDVLLCDDLQTYADNRNAIYREINIDGTTYRVEGSGTHPDFGRLPGGDTTFSPPGTLTSAGLPADLIIDTGTVMPSVPGKRFGTLMESKVIVDWTGLGIFNRELSTSLNVLRVELPVNP